MQSTPLLQIQPHFHVEVIEPKQVYLLGEQANYALTGQLYCQILPLLDGQHNREQIVESWMEKSQKNTSTMYWSASLRKVI